MVFDDDRLAVNNSELLCDDTIIAIPTVVGIAPLRGTPAAELETWRNRCLGLLCIAGHAGLPQVSVPLALVKSAAPAVPAVVA